MPKWVYPIAGAILAVACSICIHGEAVGTEFHRRGEALGAAVFFGILALGFLFMPFWAGLGRGLKRFFAPGGSVASAENRSDSNLAK